MASIAFTIDKSKVLELLGEAAGRSHLMKVANLIADEAKRLTPVLTGETAGEIFAAEGPDDENGGPTAVAGSNSPIWHIIEFGGYHNPPSRPLTAATERVVEFRPSAKP